MKLFRKHMRRKDYKALLFLPSFAFLVLGLAFANHLKLQVSAADVTSNFTITEAHVYASDDTSYELSADNPLQGLNSFWATFNWHYESDTPIADSDKITINFMQSSGGIYLTVPTMAPATIYNSSNESIGTWAISGGKMIITFSDSAVGKHSLEGTIKTARNMYTSSAHKEDRNFSLIIGNYSIPCMHPGIATLASMTNEASKGVSGTSNGIANWYIRTPGITQNELYKGEGQIALSSGAKLSNLYIEDTLTSEVISNTFVLYARVTIPSLWDEGTNGGSGYGCNYNMISFMTQKTPTEGQSYEDFKASLNDFDYGYYEDSATNSRTLVIRIGNQPSNITLSEVLAANNLTGAIGQVCTPTVESVGNEQTRLNGSENIIGGAISFFNLVISSHYNPVTLNTPISNTAKFTYDDADGQHYEVQKTSNTMLKVGSATSEIKGEAKLYLRDKATLLPISGANVKLQVKNGDTWNDVPNGAKTTGTDGSVQVLSLDSGTTYRWVQTSFLDHYLTDSYLLYSDETLQNTITEFVMPEDSGVTTYATNERESFTVTYEPGEHGNFSNIVFNNQYYGATTPQPTNNQIVGVAGWTFSGWSPSVSNTISGNATYVAQWQRQTTSQSVTSTWVDADNEDNLRPSTQRVQLLQNNNNYGPAVDLTASNHWTYTWSGLPKYSEDGATEYTYTVTTVDTVTGYTTNVSTAANGTYLVENTHMPKVSVKVTKVWDDDDNSANIRPASVAITLKADDIATGQTITLTNSKLTDNFTNLDKYSDLANKTTISYTVSESTVTNYQNPVITGDATTGFIITNTAKRGTLTVHHYLKGSTTKVADDETFTKFFGEGYDTSYKTNLANYVYDSTNGTSSDTFAGDTTVTFYYIYRTGTITTHHFIAGSTTRIVDDQSQTKNYGETYSTGPLNPMPDNYLNYAVVDAQPEGYTGTVSQSSKEVTYYYQMIDPNLSSEINLTAPETVANKTASVDYILTYDASVKEYIGNVSLVVKAQLPYPIDIDESNLAGGTFNAADNSITWPIDQTKINTYTATDQTVRFNETINFSLVYNGAQAKDTLPVTASVILSLANDKSSIADNNATTIIKTPATIIFRYIDQNGKAIQEEIEDEGFVGDQSTIRPSEISGYQLIEEEDIDYQFGEEIRIITYRYLKIENPATSTDELAPYFVIIGGLIAALSCGLYANNKRKRTWR